jgi:hypothetical protein
MGEICWRWESVTNESDPSRGLRQFAPLPAGLKECFRLHPFYIDAFIGCGFVARSIFLVSTRRENSEQISSNL